MHLLVLLQFFSLNGSVGHSLFSTSPSSSLRFYVFFPPPVFSGIRKGSVLIGPAVLRSALACCLAFGWRLFLTFF